MFESFRSESVRAAAGEVFCRIGGSGPAVLLLHGFPETHLMWRDVAPILSRRFTIVVADLPGYGASSCPPSDDQHEAYSKRAMGAALVELMRNLGFERFAIVGHDRGGRVAYRLALDWPDVVNALAVLDVVPTAEAWERANADFALGFWPWSLLAQNPPLPERLISAAPEAVIEDALAEWGSDPHVFPADVRRAYADALRDPAHVHAICEEYRAAATLDWQHDEADREAGRKIACPTLALWSGSGSLGSWYEAVGGPLAIWRRWAERVEGRAVPGGHFFPEEHPHETADLIAGFLANHAVTRSAASHPA
jgi:haloacetate dehalogenase